MIEKIRASLSGFKNILFNPINIFISSIIFFMIITIISIIQNISLFVNIIMIDYLSMMDRFYLLSQMYPFTGAYSTLFYDITISLIALFIALNVILIYEMSEFNTGSFTSAIGTSIAAISVGCITCGAALIISLFTFFGITSILLILPYNGQEFLIIALIILIISTFINSFVIEKNSCKINL